MAAWRRKLIELMPDSGKQRWEHQDSIYSAFSDLLGELGAAVRCNDIHTVSAIFDFAEWCYRQEAKDLWNAAGVSFYEHLADDPNVVPIIHAYLEPSIFFESVEPLLIAMGRKTEARKIRVRYGGRNSPDPWPQRRPGKN